MQDKVALITGASGGIGSAIAKKLTESGAQIVVSGSNQEKLDHIAKETPNSIAVACDLSDRSQRKALIDNATKAVGKPINILVNNAGIARDNLCMRMNDSSWDEVIDVNLTAVFDLCRSAIKSMMKQRMGRIIMISSVVAHGGNLGQSNYSAAKAGLEAFSKSLAREVATRNITVNCIAPGFIETPMTNNLPDNIKETLLQLIPQNRAGTPKEVANAVAFLASDDASYITGETLHVNGGMFMS